MLLLRLFAARRAQPTREKSPTSWEWLLTKDNCKRHPEGVWPRVRPTLKRRRSPFRSPFSERRQL
jgi:hypothetical protein